MVPQRLEKIESAPENGMVSEASNPQDLVSFRGSAISRKTLAGQPRPPAFFLEIKNVIFIFLNNTTNAMVTS